MSSRSARHLSRPATAAEIEAAVGVTDADRADVERVLRALPLPKPGRLAPPRKTRPAPHARARRA